jgi:hypothetical protein
MSVDYFHVLSRIHFKRKRKGTENVSQDISEFEESENQHRHSNVLDYQSWTRKRDPNIRVIQEPGGCINSGCETHNRGQVPKYEQQLLQSPLFFNVSLLPVHNSPAPPKHAPYFSQLSLNCKILSLCSPWQLSQIFQLLTAPRINSGISCVSRVSFGQRSASQISWGEGSKRNSPRCSGSAVRLKPFHDTYEISRKDGHFWPIFIQHLKHIL